MKTLTIIALFLGTIFGLKDETLAGYAPKDSLWQLIEVEGKPATAPTTLAFTKKEMLTGQAPCNQYHAKITAPMPWFEVKGVSATKRACPELSEEQRYFDLLSRSKFAEIGDRFLILSSEQETLLVFERVN